MRLSWFDWLTITERESSQLVCVTLCNKELQLVVPRQTLL